MQLEKRFKPTHTKANARYRGVTEHSQYTNFVLESAHDLLLLSHLTTGNEHKGRLGHEEEIKQNFQAVMTGDGEVQKANLFTAATLQKINREKSVPIPSMGAWELVNGCVRTATSGGHKLNSAGLQNPVGALSRLFVETGDRLYIRMKVRSATGAENMSFGSSNIRRGPSETGDLKQVNLAAGADFVTVDHIIGAGYTESITLNVNLHTDPDFLKVTEIEVKDVEVFYLQETPVQASSYHDRIKPVMDELEETINSIK